MKKNDYKMKLLNMNECFPIELIKAEGTGTYSNSESVDKAGGLVNILYLCNGAKVMLTTNIILMDCAMGTVLDVIYIEGKVHSHYLML